ncbi:MAG: Bacterial membrane protein YfhO [Bacteroidetes bacterium HLUCCA01]|nr:MAG: Bacterial membrane protein YfhO [Bacteroidetes bacterium HLUCCA01]
MGKKSVSRRKSSPSPVIAPDFWSVLPAWKQHAFVILVLLTLPAILHSPVFFGGQNFATHDIIQWRAGAESLIEHREEFGEQAQWSVSMFSGMPAYVISNLERFPHVDTLVMPLFRSMFPLIEYWILLTGAYFFLVLLGFRPLVSAVGAIIIGFTTYIPIIVGAGHNTKFIAYVWIPWVFAGFRIIFSKPDRILAGLALFVFAFMMHIRAGHPQVTYYFLFLMAVWWIYEGIDAFKAGTLPGWLRNTALLIGVGLLSAFSVMEQYWSIYDYSTYSIRGGSQLEGTTGLGYDYAFVWSQGWAELLTLSIPNLFGGGELYWGPKPVTSGPHYFGGLATIFLIAGLVLARKKHTRIFLTTALLAIFFSLGKHFTLLNGFMFDYFPFFNKFRTPEMWLMLAVFCLTVPAMDGLQFLADKAGELRGALKSRFLGAGGAVLASMILLFALSLSLDFEKDGERGTIAQQVASQNQVSPEDPRVTQAVDRIMNEQLLPERKSAAQSDLIRYIIMGTAAAGLIGLLLAGKIAPSIVLMGIVALTAFDMISTGKRYIPESAYSPRGMSVTEVIEEQRRPVDTWLEEAVKTDEGWSYRVFPLGDNAFNNAVPAYFYPSIGGYSGARMSIYDELQGVISQTLSRGETGSLSRILSMLNVRYVTFGGRYPGYSPAFTQGPVIANENPDVFPKAWFVEGFEVVDSPEASLQALVDPEINLRSTAVVFEQPGVTPMPDSLARVQITDYNAHRIEAEVTRSTDGFVVFSEIYYPAGWKARLNGEPVEIHRTNHVLRGIAVPAGSHQLVMQYEPEWYKPVRTVSNIANILALLLIAGALGATYLPKRKPAAIGD